MIDIDALKYPIGKFTAPAQYTPALMQAFIEDIAAFPTHLKREVAHLSDQQLDTPYRPEGWTLRQVVHHCADSHANSIIRFKLALTEEQPIIKPYWEDRWAELFDYQGSIDTSLMWLEGLHAKWTQLLKSMKEEQFARSFVHPEHGRSISLYENTANYSWHGKHHLAHITTLKKSKGWV